MSIEGQKWRWWTIASSILKFLRVPLSQLCRSKVFLQVIPVFLIILVWWIVATIMDNPRIFPSPLMVGEEFLGIINGTSPFGSSYSHIAATFIRFIAAFGLSFFIGITVGLIIGRNKLLFSLFDNLAWIFISVPAILWAFISVVTFGITDFVPIIVLMALLIPKVALIIAEGAKATPPDIVEMANSFSITIWQKITDIFVPHLMPYLIASARVAFGIGVKVVIVAEVVGLTTGIGFMVKYWYDQAFLAPLIAWGIVLVCLALLFEYTVFDILERKLTKWRTTGEQTFQIRGE